MDVQGLLRFRGFDFGMSKIILQALLGLQGFILERGFDYGGFRV